MKTTTRNFWGIQDVTMDGEKALRYRGKDGLLYFAIDKRKNIIPPPALFLTKKQAEKEIKKLPFRNKKKSIIKMKRMFEEVVFKSF